MKKKEYLPFHAKILFAASTEIKKPIYWAFSEEQKINALLEDNYYHRGLAKKLETEQELLKALDFGAKMEGYGFYYFCDKYLEKALLEGNEEQIEFFVKNNKSLIGEFRLEKINTFIPKLTENIILTIFTKGSNTFGTFSFQDFEKTIDLVKDHPKATLIVNSYLNQRQKAITNEYELLNIRTQILKFFPDKLNEFSDLPIIKDYLNSIQGKVVPFLQTDITKTIYLRLNCDLLKQAYPLSFGTFKFYSSSLKSLIKAFEKSSNDTGVVKVHVNDSIPAEIGYQYTHIYINLNSTSNLSENDIKEIIYEYYGNYLITLKDTQLNNLETITEKWVKTKLLYNGLNQDMKENDSSSKKTVKL
jgi:hypothetical protein